MEDKRQIREIFSGIADRYDSMNDLMSGGLHKLWKMSLINALNVPRRGEKAFRVLDMAAGSGDIGLEILRKGGEGVEVVLADPNLEMLSLAGERAGKMGSAMGQAMRKDWSSRLHFLLSEAESLPLQAGGFDAYTISFGIRNVSDRAEALRESFRVLRAGGRFLCLEFAVPEHPWLRPLYEAYMKRLVPPLGRFVVGNAKPYHYLRESIRAFPPPRRFAGFLEDAGFSRIEMRPLSGGIAILYSAWRL